MFLVSSQRTISADGSRFEKKEKRITGKLQSSIKVTHSFQILPIQCRDPDQKQNQEATPDLSGKFRQFPLEKFPVMFCLQTRERWRRITYLMKLIKRCESPPSHLSSHHANKEEWRLRAMCCCHPSVDRRFETLSFIKDPSAA